MSLANRFNLYQWYAWFQRKGEYFNRLNFQRKMQENLPVLHSLFMYHRVYPFTSSAGESSVMTIFFDFVSMFVCKFVCLFGFLLVYWFVTVICLVSWLIVFFVVCFCVSSLSTRLPTFFVCLFCLVFNVFLCLWSSECIFFFRPIFSWLKKLCIAGSEICNLLCPALQ